MGHVVRNKSHIKTVANLRLLHFFGLFFFLLSGQGFCNPSEDLFSLIISKNIRPYIEAAEGFQEIVLQHEQFDAAVYFLANNAESGKELPWQRITATSVIVAIGPEALDATIQYTEGVKSAVFYMMVSKPRDVIKNRRDICGISLNIPPLQQMKAISERLPELKSIGLLFDPAYNDAFYREATFSAGDMGMAIVPLTVSTKKEISQVLDDGWDRIDALWMIPDHTIISESLVRYIIKDGLLNDRPVIGYNRFFYEAGASVAFAFDYNEIGRQAARTFIESRETGNCTETSPPYSVLINTKVLNKIGLSIQSKNEPDVEVEP